MKKVAILIDGEWFRVALTNSLGKLPTGITAEIMYKNALLAVEAVEEVFRIFYYDSEPSTTKSTNPFNGQQVDNTSPGKISARQRFFEEMGRQPFVALRKGVIRPRDWVLKQTYVEKVKNGTATAPPIADDFMLTMVQKGVDMRIGIDVATLSLKGLVERIILICGDTDMIPAMKLARREGVQVIVANVSGRRPAAELIEDADLVRDIAPKASFP